VKPAARRPRLPRPPARKATKRAARATARKPIEHRVLMTATLCLLAFGAVMVYSASSARNVLQSGGDGTGFLIRYVVFGAVGLAGMRFLSRRGLDGLRQLTPVALAGSFALVLLVLVPGFGVQVNGARRWLGASALQFQPSELLKISLVLYAAGYLATHPKRIQTFRGMIQPLLLVFGGACLLVALEPDLGTALVIAFTCAALLIAAGVPIRYLLYVLGIGAFLVMVFAILEPYRRARLATFLNPWTDPGGAGFQAVQGQIALGSGGLLGKGIGQSTQKAFFLPEAHTDFILAVIGEELGLLGIFGVLTLYAMILWAGLRTARKAVGAYAKLLAAGLTSLFLCQAALNIFVVLGLAPLTGVPLPLISYGQTNLCVMLAAVGLLLNIAAGGTVKLRVVDGGGGERSADRDRRRRNGRARGARAGGRRRAAG
jgi:cell division protein FtsW